MTAAKKSGPARSRKRRKWRPTPPELITAFTASIRPLAGATQRMTFGYPGAYIKGRLFACMFEDRLVLKLPVGPRAELLKLPGATPFAPIPGRTMGEYVVAPSLLLETRTALRRWMAEAHAYVGSLPPKDRLKRRTAS